MAQRPSLTNAAALAGLRGASVRVPDMEAESWGVSVPDMEAEKGPQYIGRSLAAGATPRAGGSVATDPWALGPGGEDEWGLSEPNVRNMMQMAVPGAMPVYDTARALLMPATPPRPPSPQMFQGANRQMPAPTPVSPNDAGMAWPTEAAVSSHGPAAAGPVGGLRSAANGIRWSQGAPTPQELAQERGAFLATGQSPEIAGMADALQVQQQVQENQAKRPGLYGNAMRLAGLQRAAAETPQGQSDQRARVRQEMDTDQARMGPARAEMGNRVEAIQTRGAAERFMDPAVAKARFTGHEEALNLAQNPVAQALLQQGYSQEQVIAAITALGRASGGGMPGDTASLERLLNGQGGQPQGQNMPARRGQPVAPMDLVARFAKEKEITPEQAAERVRALGYEVR